MTDERQLPEASHVFWKKAKGKVLYVSGRKHPLYLKDWKGQVVRVLHKKAGGEPYGERSLMDMHKYTE